MSIPDLALSEHAFFHRLPPGVIADVAGAARLVEWPAGGFLFREGSPATELYAVRQGRVSLEVHVPGRGRVVVDTVDADDIVGLSWLIPPYRWMFDAHLPVPGSALAVDAAALRATMATNDVVAAALQSRLLPVMYGRLQATRMRLLDLYAAGLDGAPRAGIR